MYDPDDCEAHRGPGRRFALGSTRGDHLLGAIGFLAHAFLFLGLAALACWQWPGAAGPLAVVTLALTAATLVVRGPAAGAAATGESIEAIKRAWSRKEQT